MEIRNLRTFLKIAELQNFTKAAEALGYSQSAVTIQIQQLENELGVKLFDRLGKNIKLTQYGHDFIEYADSVLKAVDRAAHFASDQEVISGVVHFGVSDSILNSIFTKILPEFHHRYPLIRVSMFVGSARDIERKLRANELDLAYMLDYKMPNTEWVRVREEKEPITFVSNPNGHLSLRDIVTFEELKNETLIMMPSGEGYRYLFDDELAKRNLFAEPFLELVDTDTIIRMVQEHDYVSLLPVFATRKAVNAGKIKLLNVENMELYQWSQLIYLKGKAITPQIRAFIDTTLELLGPVNTIPEINT